MRVAHVSLKNWRNFRSVDVDLADRMFLVGPNASGKSNFLDVFRFLRDIARSSGGGGLQKAIDDRGGLAKIRCLAARRSPDVEIRVEVVEEPNTWVYELGIRRQQAGEHLPVVSCERVVHNGTMVLKRPDDEDKHDPLRLTQTHLEQINANKPFRPVAEFFSKTLYLHLVPQLLRHPEAFSGQGLPGDPFGRSFLERVAATPSKTRDARLRMIQRALQLTVPQFKELKYIRDDKGVSHLQALYEHWRPHGAYQQEDQFSDGTLRLLALLWSLLEGESLLLLEEPELSLHAAIVEKLPALIYRLQRKRKRQVFISTHSPELLLDKGIGGEEILLLRPDAEGTEVTTGATNFEVRLLLKQGFSPGEVVIAKTAPSDQMLMDSVLSE